MLFTYRDTKLLSIYFELCKILIYLKLKYDKINLLF